MPLSCTAKTIRRSCLWGSGLGFGDALGGTKGEEPEGLGCLLEASALSHKRSYSCVYAQCKYVALSIVMWVDRLVLQILSDQKYPEPKDHTQFTTMSFVGSAAREFVFWFHAHLTAQGHSELELGIILCCGSYLGTSPPLKSYIRRTLNRLASSVDRRSAQPLARRRAPLPD